MTDRGGEGVWALWRRLRGLWLVCAMCASCVVDRGGDEAGGPADVGLASDAVSGPDDADTAVDAGGLPPAPVLREVTPTQGPPEGGTRVTLRGAGFAPGLRVFFGQTAAARVEVLGPAEAVALSPPHPPGRVDVAVAGGDDEDAALVRLPYAFEYVGTLRVDGVEPPEVSTAGGDVVTVRGAGFTAEVAVVVGRSGRAAAQLVDASTLLVVVPPDDFGVRDLHVASASEVATAGGALVYREAPRLDARRPSAPVPEGDAWVLHGAGLTLDTVVTVDGAPVETWKASSDGRSLTLVAPEGLMRLDAPAEVVAANAWGVAARAFPAAGDEAGCAPLSAPGDARGGDVVVLWCPDAGEAAAFAVGAAAARVVAREAGFVALLNPGGEAGEVEISAREAGGLVAVARWRLALPAGATRVTGLAPSEGPTEGGGRAYVSGGPFATGAVVKLGASTAGGVRLEPDGRLSFEVPAGPPGVAELQVIQGGERARLPGAWTWQGDGLALVAASPRVVSRAGGARVTLVGGGFQAVEAVTIGGVASPVVARRGGGELVVVSPRLEPGAHDVAVRTRAGETAQRVGLVVAHDPRSALGGTWGGPVEGAIDVTVETTDPPRPLPGATVHVTTPAGEALVGLTDDRGQVTLSAEGLSGPLDVSATAPDYTAASLIEVDARHVTITLYPNPPPPPEGGAPPEPPPNAVLSGRVSGLDKHVTAPAAGCEGLVADGVMDCWPCAQDDASDACGGDPALACIARELDGREAFACLRTCDAQTAACPDGYVCGPTGGGERCVPKPGVRAAVCNVTTPGGFGWNYAPQPTGWADAEGRYVLDSRRLGELAVWCVGGYRHEDGTFTPVVLGVRRHVFAVSGVAQRGLDVTLEHPLRRTVRARIPEPPEAGGLALAPPVVALSLDLGPDGAIGMTRAVIPDETSGFWRIPRQLERLSGALADARYLVQTTLGPVAPRDLSGAPLPHPLASARSYNLITAAQALMADSLPVRDEAGRWRLDPAQLERDLHGLWGGPDGRLVAVGERGLILLLPAGGGAGWTRQSSPTGRTLRAVAGGPEALWAVGDGGVVLAFDGRGWREAANLGADLIGAAQVEERLVVAGREALWRRAEAGEGWEALEGAAGATLAALSDAADLALGVGGGVWRVEAGGLARVGQTDGRTLRAAAPLGARALAVGDDGVIARVDANAGAVELITEGCEGLGDADLTAVAATGPLEVVAVGERGVALTLREGSDGALRCEVARIPGYRSRPAAAARRPDGSLRVVGSAAFDLGPFLAFPEAAMGDVLGPLPAPLAWRWRGGPAAQYTRLSLTPATGPTAWALVVEGGESRAILPDVAGDAGGGLLTAGAWRWDVTRVLSPGFDLDAHTSRSFGVMTRDSWSTNQISLVIAPR